MRYSEYQMPSGEISPEQAIRHASLALDHADKVCQLGIRPANWRKGQTWCNSLPDFVRDIIIGTPADPFYVDDRIPAAREMIEEKILEICADAENSLSKRG